MIWMIVAAWILLGLGALLLLARLYAWAQLWDGRRRRSPFLSWAETVESLWP